MEFRSIEKFTGKENLEYYLQRLESVFKILKVDDNLKVHFLLIHLSYDVYEVVANKFSPIKPADKSFDEICSVLKNCYSLKPLEIAENYKFYKRKQKDGESLHEFVHALQSMAQNCGFGDYLEKAVRNQFTFGIKDESIRARLLQIRDLDLRLAFYTAVVLQLGRNSANSNLQTPINHLNKELASVSNASHSNMEYMVGFKTQKERLLKLQVKEKPKVCSQNYVELKSILKWSDHYVLSREELKKEFEENISDFRSYISEKCDVNMAINNKIALWTGDITTLEFDAVVNAANYELFGGNGVDGAIHKSAGPLLKKECKTLNGCEIGNAKITGGYRLPAKYIIHTVGPTLDDGPALLESCYKNCLNLMLENGLKTIAFPCISTGALDYPQLPAASVALRTVRNFLERHVFDVDLVVFSLFLDSDVRVYKNLAQIYFPME